jgi:O-antigen ligase
MIRLSLLAVTVLGLAIYAWRDWYKSLCGLVLLMAIIERPDMPRSLAGVRGLTPWNLLLLNIVLAWLASRRREGLRWDMPRGLGLAVVAYVTVVIAGFVRMVPDDAFLGLRTSDMVSQYFVNPLKFILPALLMFDGCRSRARLKLAMFTLIGLYMLLALQTIRLIPPRFVLDAAELERRSAKILQLEVGYHRIDVSMMLAGASWATLAAREIVRRRRVRLLMLGMSVAMVYAQALTAGRAGYATWAAVGLVVAALRWRRYLLIAPLLAAAVVWAVPGAAGRMMQGVSVEDTLDTEDRVDEVEVTSGRSIIWPYVIETIGEAPFFGYGREAMFRSGLADFLADQLNERFMHPHNAYLEMLLDAGWVGFAMVMPVYLLALWQSVGLFRDRRSRACVAAGGMGLALVLALLFASVGAQTLYPREGTVGMWCAMGLVFRVWLERARRSPMVLEETGRSAPEPRRWPFSAAGPPAAARAG